jgi:hypothetical protein
MQITYELTQKDFTEAYTVHRKDRTLSRWSRRILISILVLMAGICPPRVRDEAER